MTIAEPRTLDIAFDQSSGTGITMTLGDKQGTFLSLSPPKICFSRKEMNHDLILSYPTIMESYHHSVLPAQGRQSVLDVWVFFSY